MDSRDSHFVWGMIQGCFLGSGRGCNGPFGAERRGVGADGAVDHRSARSEGFDGPQQPDVRRSGAVDRATGSPWRGLPEVFGDWNSVFRRFSQWSIKGVWWRISEAMSDDPDFEYLIIDSTVVRAHQHAAGAKKGDLRALKSSEAGKRPIGALLSSAKPVTYDGFD